MIALTDPDFGEKIYDPFCGTGGFLSIAFDYIRDKNKLDHIGLERLKKETLFGREYSPEIANIAKMNMILHGDGHTGIKELDSLDNPVTEKYDVVVTNIPFSQEDKPSEKYFYNELGENKIKGNGDAVCLLHCLKSLKSGGRMAVIVPEGLLFRENKYETATRKFLLENAKLQSIVSLPKGVFKPYTDVKTNILYFTDCHYPNDQKEYWYFDVKDDGFSLDAYRYKLEGNNDIDKVNSSKIVYEDEEKEVLINTGFELIPIEKVKKNKYNLCGSIYRELPPPFQKTVSSWEWIELGEVCDIKTGKKDVNAGNPDGQYPFFTCAEEHTFSDEFSFDTEALLIAGNGYVGQVTFYKGKFEAYQRTYVLDNFKQVLPKYLYFVLRTRLPIELDRFKQGTATPYIKIGMLMDLQIPLPPIEIQQDKIEELEKLERTIKAAEYIVNNNKPEININTSWKLVKFKNAPFKIIDGDRGKNYPSKSDFSEEGYCLFLNTNNVKKDGFDFSKKMFIDKEKDEQLRKGKLQVYDVVLTTRGTIGNTAYFNEKVKYQHIRINSGMVIFRVISEELSPEYLFYFFQSKNFSNQFEKLISGSAQPQLPISSLNKINIPIPDKQYQRNIIEEIKSEKLVVEGNKKIFIEKNLQKMKDKINSLWEPNNG